MKYLVYKPNFRNALGVQLGDHYLSSMGKWDASYTPFMSRAIVYDMHDGACAVARLEINKGSYVMSIEKKDLFKAILQSG